VTSFLPVPKSGAAQFSDKDARRVAYTEIGDINVSTVFLGMNHRTMGPGEPLLFETMIFGGDMDGELERCSTYAQAEEMHQRICDMVTATVRKKLH